MLVTVIIVLIIAVIFFLSLRGIINNVKQGRSIDGCDGDCAHCSGHHEHASSKAKKGKGNSAGSALVKTIVGIDGMSCGMCEAHINDAVRKAFQVKKVSSSHTKNMTEILADRAISEEEIRRVIEPTGYKVVYVKTGEGDR